MRQKFNETELNEKKETQLEKMSKKSAKVEQHNTNHQDNSNHTSNTQHQSLKATLPSQGSQLLLLGTGSEAPKRSETTVAPVQTSVIVTSHLAAARKRRKSGERQRRFSSNKMQDRSATPTPTTRQLELEEQEEEEEEEEEEEQHQQEKQQHRDESPNSDADVDASRSTSGGTLTEQSDNICAACMKPIKERYLLVALDKQWHEDCLKCACCDCRLGEVGSSLFTHSDKILCRRDFLRIFGQHGHCAACKKSIPPYEMVMRANENAYHMDCFACQQCQYRFCVGDRFHLTESHRIVCILCHTDAQQQHHPHQHHHQHLHQAYHLHQQQHYHHRHHPHHQQQHNELSGELPASLVEQPGEQPVALNALGCSLESQPTATSAATSNENSHTPSTFQFAATGPKAQSQQQQEQSGRPPPPAQPMKQQQQACAM